MENPQHLEMVADIGRYYNRMEKLAKPVYQDDFDLTISRLNRSATLCESFDQFHKRQDLVTPLAPDLAPPMEASSWRQSPVVAITNKHSPVVEPMTPDGFMN